MGTDAAAIETNTAKRKGEPRDGRLYWWDTDEVVTDARLKSGAGRAIHDGIELAK